MKCNRILLLGLIFLMVPEFLAAQQNLKIKSFLGTSSNAVLTQIWVAMCMYLLLAFIKFMSKLGASLQQILRLLHLNILERRDLIDLLQNRPKPGPKTINANQLSFL